MLEAVSFAELVALALSSEALPSDSPVEKRDIELLNAFNLPLRQATSKRYTDAAKLALRLAVKALAMSGNATPAREYRLGCGLYGKRSYPGIVSRKTFGSGWVGSHHAYEAGLLSDEASCLGEARTGFGWRMNGCET